MKNNLKIGIFSLFAVFFMFTLSVCSNDGSSESRTGWAEGRSIPYTFSPDYYENEDWFPEPYEFFEDDDYFRWFDNYEESMYVIRSIEELKKTVEEVKLYEIDKRFEKELFVRRDLLSKYDESYFDEYILICWYVMEYSTPTNNRIYSLNVNGKTLTVHLIRARPGSHQSVGLDFIEIQVKKADIAGVINVEKVTRYVTSPPRSVTVHIEGYYDKKLTLDDFGKEYFSEIEMDLKWGEPFNCREIRLSLKTPGLKLAKAAKKHLETLYFSSPCSVKNNPCVSINFN